MKKTVEEIITMMDFHSECDFDTILTPEDCGVIKSELTRLQKENEELLAKIAQIKASLPDNKIRDLNPIWVRDEIVKRLTNK